MWLFVPGSKAPASSPFVLGSEGWISPSDWRFRALARLVTWRETPMPPGFWRQLYREAAWTRLLVGAICEPSTADAGVASWISSLGATLARPSRAPGSASEQQTHATSGPMSPGSSESVSPSGVSSKMSPGICHSAHAKSSESFRAWASELRRASLLRRKSAPLNAESGSSSWPTPRASLAEQRTYRQAPSVTSEGHGRHLSAEASTWSSPTASDANGARTMARGNPALNMQAQRWPTPTEGDSRSSGSRNLPGSSAHPGVSLTDAVLRRPLFPTPTTQDAENNGGPAQARRKTPPLNTYANSESMSSLPDPESVSNGSTTSSETPVLSPRFVEALMGFPGDWTGLGDWEIAWSRSREPEPSSGSSTNSNPTQLELL